MFLACTTLGACTEKKNIESARLVEKFRALYEPALAKGLSRSQRAVTLNEFDTLRGMFHQEGVVSVLYLNKFGEVRWSTEPKLFTLPFDDVQSSLSVPVESIASALRENRVKYVKIPDKDFRYIILPVRSRKELVGLLVLGTKTIGIARLIRNAGHLIKRKVSYTDTLSSPENEISRAFHQHYLSGIILYQNGDLEQAQREWEKADRLKPGDPDVREGLDRLIHKAPEEYARACRMSYAKGKLEKAAVLCKKCKDLDPAFRFCGKILSGLIKSKNLPGLGN